MRRSKTTGCSEVARNIRSPVKMALIVTEAIVISYINKLCVEETVRWIDIEIVDSPRRPGLCRLPALFLVLV